MAAAAKGTQAPAPAPDGKSGGRRDRPLHTKGNYPRYYDAREDPRLDPRLKALAPDLFVERRCLDLGCNLGAVTVTLARRFRCHSMVGVDVDEVLVARARATVQRLQREAPRCADIGGDDASGEARPPGGADGPTPEPDADNETALFPVSVVQKKGLLPPRPALPPAALFPHNVSFEAGEAVAALSKRESASVDTILCLSTTKWIHFAGGDLAIQTFFCEVHRVLAGGGALVLEPQPWTSYKRKKHVSPEARAHYRAIRLRPELFPQFLVDYVGFRSCEEVRVEHLPTESAGFTCRPLFIFLK